MHPKTAPSLLKRGKAHLKNHEYIDAAAILQEAAKKSPGDINVLIALGEAWEKLQKESKARECYLQALAINPAAVQIHQGLARLHLQGPHYLEGLRRIHMNLKPSNYVEIGVRDGASFRYANPDIPAVGIDPNPLLDRKKLPKHHLIIQDTSDNYFQSDRLSSDLSGQPVDLAFIDGMHLFEFALRDFIALEKAAHPDATILIHDCYPLNELTANREQNTHFWSGDVWKVILCLKQYRPDLKIITLPCPPTGLAVVTNLDPLSTVLSDSLKEIYNEFVTMDFSVIEKNQEQKLNLAEISEVNESRYLKK